MREQSTLQKKDIEEGNLLAPKFDANGLVPVVAQHADTGEILMLAYMNAEALRKTIETRLAHYYSRSRQSLWLKGETSGQTQEVADILVDCDQDAVVLKVRPQGNGGCCHVGYRSCFFRSVEDEDTLWFNSEKL
ncbi:phosphoribosyl-AMP cyclohydrolase [Hwanghaeella sp.]|uniref:phosphoribosyl-AMP cyclohydrolase n=1 Tax=Hwanghaeella sp. TaxID=2605943 RepID=UPI003CCBFE48